MSGLEPTKQHIKETLLAYFNLEKSAAEIHRMFRKRVVNMLFLGRLAEIARREFYSKFYHTLCGKNT